MNRRGKLRVGDWVEVRSKEEILATLDEQGRLDRLPFMPEMFGFCGRRFRVHKRAHKTCDTVFPIRGRRMARAVHLETRCDGTAHGGCQASCLLFWKEEWLKPVNSDQLTEPSIAGVGDTPRHQTEGVSGCNEHQVWAGISVIDREDAENPTYICQNTQIPYATTDLPWWELGQYLEDYLSGNIGLWKIIKGTCYSAYYHLSEAGIGVGRVMRWIYDALCPLMGGTKWPRKRGAIPRGEPTPTGELNLQPGELVRVKSHDEILKTLNTDSKNRGMYWDAEMVPYCGGTYRVLKRVTRIIDEKTGKMVEMKNPCIILNTVVCQSRYSHCRMFCPRAFYSYWREIWLERVGMSAGEGGLGKPADAEISPCTNVRE